MQLGAGAGRHAHQRNDHAVAFDAGAFDRGVVRPSLDGIDAGQIEDVLARSGALGARCARGRRWVRHAASSSLFSRRSSRATLS
jgi:hypothetical protein